MQWDDSENAGFSTGEPWLPVHPNYPSRNLAAQQADEDSLFNLTRGLIALRKTYPVLRRGSFTALKDLPRATLGFLRQDQNDAILVILNFSAKKKNFPLPERNWEVLLSTYRGEEKIEQELILFPNEVLLLKEVK